MPEAIICSLPPLPIPFLRRRVALVDPGDGGRLEVRVTDGSPWVTYIGRTDPRGVGGLIDQLTGEIMSRLPDLGGRRLVRILPNRYHHMPDDDPITLVTVQNGDNNPASELHQVAHIGPPFLVNRGQYWGLGDRWEVGYSVAEIR